MTVDLDSLPVILTPREACDLLRCSRKVLDGMTRRGILPYFKLGDGRSSRVRIRRDEVLKLSQAEGRAHQRRRTRQAAAEHHRAQARIGGGA